MLDLEFLIYSLLSRGLPQYNFAPDLDIDAIDEFPLITFTVVGGNAVIGSPSPPTAWDAQLALTVFNEGLKATRDVAREVYDEVWSWDDPWKGKNILDGVGHAAAIEDQALLTRTNTVAIRGREISQYDGSFGMQLHKA